MKPPTRVIPYLRVSTQEQAISGLGLAAQRAAVTQHADLRQWEIVAWAVDDGYTAATLARPALTAALTSLRTGAADALVVSKLDRLSRSLLDFAGLMERAQREGWNVVCLDVGIDLSTPAGEMMANVLASFSQYERRLISQRTRDALAALKAQGVQLGRPRCVSPATAALIAADRAAGASYRTIAARLNATATPTAHDGKQWYGSTVRKILRSTERRAAAL